jgi:hypothetical protein
LRTIEPNNGAKPSSQHRLRFCALTGCLECW